MRAHHGSSYLRTFAPLLLVVAALLPGALHPVARAQQAAPKPTPAANYGKLPLSFEANHGQTDPQVRFLSRGNGYALFLTDTAAVLSLQKASAPTPPHGLSRPGLKRPPAPATPPQRDVVRMELAGARPGLRVAGADKLPGTANYFLGNDAARWRSAIPTYARVRYDGVYPGVDLVYYGNQRQLEYDFVVAPQADPRSIRLHFAGARKLKLSPDGDLEILAANGQIAFHKPLVYQQTAGRRQPVAGRFTLLAHNTVAFALGPYDHAQPLTIDPTLAYSTYLGGSSTVDGSIGYNVAVDASGSAYIVGVTSSVDFPTTPGSFQPIDHSYFSGGITYGLDMFVLKLNPTGTGLVYSTFLGGTGSPVGSVTAGDSPTSLTLDAAGNAYISGEAYSTDFPTTPGAYQTVNRAAARQQANGFVTKLNATGTALVYSTYLGGSGSTVTYADGDGCGQVKVDAAGNAYVVGVAQSVDFPTTPGAYQTTATGANFGFVTKLNPTGSALLYSTLLLGTETFVVSVDSAGDAFVAGEAVTGFLTTPGAYQPAANPAAPYNGFVAKLNPAGSGLLYATFLGGSGTVWNGTPLGDGIYNLVVNAAGEAYVSGATASNDFPTTPGAPQTINKARNPAPPGYAVLFPTNYFVSRLNATGTALIFSTYLGSSGGESSSELASMALDASENIYLTGTSFGIDFPTTANAFQPHNNSAGHGFIIQSPTASIPDPPVYAATGNAVLTELSSTGGLVYSTYFGGSGYPAYIYPPLSTVSSITSYSPDQGLGLALDANGNVYLTGEAESPDFPILSGAYRTAKTAQIEAFVAKFNFGASAYGGSLTALTASANPQNVGSTVTFTAHVQPLSGGGTPSGLVTFTIDGTTTAPITLDSTGRASYATNNLAVGTHTVVVNYNGSGTYAASGSNVLTEAIAALPLSSLVLTASPASPVNTHTLVTLTATATSTGSPIPAGFIAFYDGSFQTGAGAVALNAAGTATIRFYPGVGTHTYIATFYGTSAVGRSSSPQLTYVVRPAANYPTANAATARATGTSIPARVNAATSYTIADTLTLYGQAAPTGTIRFLDTTTSTVLGSVTPAALTQTFAAPTAVFSNAARTGTLQSAIGDFNGDGIPDIAAANLVEGTVSILLGSGNGTFKPAVAYTAGAGAYAIGVGDFNADGIQDLAVTNLFGNTVSVLLGVGNGTFRAQTTYATGTEPYAITIADWNNDGILDLAVTNLRDKTAGVLLGKGDGTFLAQATTAVGTDPCASLAADFDGDGRLDLLVLNGGDNTVGLLRGNGDGTFQPQVTTATGTTPYAMTLGDFNGDGKLDVAVANLADNTVGILLGAGGGAFLPQVAYPTGAEPTSVVAFNFDGTGRQSLAIANNAGNTFSVLVANDNGTFQPQRTFPTLTTAPVYQLSVADFNGDGKQDLAITTFGGNLVGVQLGAQTATASVNAALTGTHQVTATYVPGTADAYATSVSNTVVVPPAGAVRPLPPVAPVSLRLTN